MAPRFGDGPAGGFLASASRFWARSYASDYLGFVVLLVGYLLLAFFVQPFHRMFAISDLRIAFPHAEHERVPLVLNFVYALFAPLGTILLVLFLARAPVHKVHVAVLGLAIAVVLTSFVTDLVKNAVGRPRPDLLARCLPARGTPQDVLVGIDVCTQTDSHVLQDGWRSFPSGHSSFSFAGLGYLSLFLAGQLKLFVLKGHGRSWGPRERSRGGGGGSLLPTAADVSSGPITIGGAGDGTGAETPGATWHPSPGPIELAARGDLLRALACLAPLLGAAMIAISRCEDYRHDVYDVCVGSLLGIVVAYWSYRRYWPRLSSPRCAEPYSAPPPGAAGAEAAEEEEEEEELHPYYGRIRDEEEGLPNTREERAEGEEGGNINVGRSHELVPLQG